MIKIGSSETIRKTSLDFNLYKQHLPLHIKNINPDFLEWFVGFSEGDGSFIDSKGRLFFIINQKEERVLHLIRAGLGFGKVSTYKSDSRYIVADRANLDRLISIFNGNLLLDKTNRRFKAWLEVRNSYSREKVSLLGKREIPSLGEGSWLSGFIDAEGCFNVVRAADPHCSLGCRVRLRFILDQKGEVPVLEGVRSFLRSGLISKPLIEKPLQPDLSKVAGDALVPCESLPLPDMFRFTSTRITSHEILIEYLGKHPLRTLKRVSFVRFATLLRYIKMRPSLPWEGKVLKKVERLLKRLES